MKRYLLTLSIGVFILLGAVFFFSDLFPAEDDVYSLIPPQRIRGIAVLGEDDSEQGVRAWLEQWFVLKRISPGPRLFIRYFFPRSTTLVFYPAKEQKVDWLLIGNLGKKAKLLRFLRFWWEEQLVTYVPFETNDLRIKGGAIKVYAKKGEDFPAFFSWRNYLFACSSQAVQQSFFKALAKENDGDLPLPQNIKEELYRTDGNRDGSFYLMNQEGFWNQFAAAIPQFNGDDLGGFLSRVKSVRGNFDFVDLNRFRFIFFFKMNRKEFNPARKTLTAWGESAKKAFATLGLDLEFFLKEHPKWEEIRLIFYPHKIGHYFAYLENSAAARVAQVGSSFSGFTLSESELDQLSWSLKTRQATVDKDETTIECEELTFNWFEKGELSAELTSQSGIVTREPLTLTAKGRVWLKAGENTIETEELLWDRESDLVTSEKRVKITRKDDIMTGTGLKATPDLKNIEVLQDVKIVLKKMPEAFNKQP